VAYDQHIRSSGDIVARCGVITLSDTRTESSDGSGAKIKALLKAAGHEVVDYRLTREEPDLIDNLLSQWLGRNDLDVILTNGGTGISRRDRTLGAIEKHLEFLLPGFGELFRSLSFAEIGSGAMLSRAAGGVSGGKLIFAMPGSTGAVELAMTRLILPELRHLIAELRKG